MRPRRTMSLIPLVALVLPAGLVAQEPVEDLRPGVTVFPFQDGGWVGLSVEDREALGIGLQQVLLNELAANSNLRIVERGILRQMMEEIGLAADGVVDPQTAARVGQMVGAQFVILATFTDVAGTRPTLIGNIVKVETSEILQSEEVAGGADALYPMVVDLAAEVTAAADLPALPSQQREARRSREIPTEALRLYSRAQTFRDLGRVDEARQLLLRISQDFPTMTEAEEELRQLDAV